MCFIDDVQAAIDQMESLKQFLALADESYKAEDDITFQQLLKEMQPDLLYVAQCLLGVVSLREDRTPNGDPMPVVDRVDEDALFHAFI